MPDFVARQPILDRKQNTYAYELLFRSSLENMFRETTDGDQATFSVIERSLFGMGMGAVTAGRKAFVNCTRYLLVNDYAMMLPKENVVVEILETIEPEDAVVEACYRLKNAGYTIALDDYVGDRPEYADLIAVADIIKVDILNMPSQKRLELAEQLLPMGVKLLAEKVETVEDFEETRDLGYSYFQGYFFDKPQVLQSNAARETKMAKMRVLQELLKPDYDPAAVEDIIKHDPALATKLLRFVNSVAFGLRNEISDIRRAINLLGAKQLRKLVTVLTLAEAGDSKPNELMRQIVVRARFAELLAEPLQRKTDDQDLFMVGMLSLLDALMDQSMEHLVGEIALHDPVRDALLGQESPYLNVLRLLQAFEAGDWERVEAVSERIGLSEAALPEIYQSCITWADEFAHNL
jgi:EAL and modified HD-GYP domain-containing signal transduction protein